MNLVLNSIFPVFATIILGNLLRRFQFTNAEFFRRSDRLIYFIFFPAMLFWKIGNPKGALYFDWNLILSTLLAILAIYLCTLIFAKIAGMPAYAVGSFSQCCYRFNTYVGMAVILGCCGERGVQTFGVLIAFAIPFINVLAVATLIWFGQEKYSIRRKAQFILTATLSNPLIVACLLGIVYARLGIPLPTFIDNTFRLIASVTLPMALMSIGSSLTVVQLQGHFKFAMAASLAKLLILPLVGYTLMAGFRVTGLGMQVGMIFFALPTSTASYILSSQLNSDVELAKAGIVLSTLLSFISLSATLLLFAR